jgi:hypothetical protein
MNELDRLIYWRKEAEEEATKELENCKKKGICIDKEKYEYPVFVGQKMCQLCIGRHCYN